MNTLIHGKTLSKLLLAGVVAGTLGMPADADARRRGYASYGYPHYGRGYSYSSPYYYSSRYSYPYYYSSRYSYPSYYTYPRYRYSSPYSYYSYSYPYYW